MELCDHHHEEICYRHGTCPMCTLIDELSDQVSALQNDLDEARSQLRQLEKETAEYPEDFVRWAQVKNRIEGDL